MDTETSGARRVLTGALVGADAVAFAALIVFAPAVTAAYRAAIDSFLLFAGTSVAPVNTEWASGVMVLAHGLMLAVGALMALGRFRDWSDPMDRSWRHALGGLATVPVMLAGLAAFAALYAPFVHVLGKAS